MAIRHTLSILGVVIPALVGCASPREPTGEPSAGVELVEGPTGIRMVSPAGAASARWDLWSPDSASPISQAHEVGTLLAAEPGSYVATEYANADFTWASVLPVEDGKTTVVRLGAVHVIAPAGAVSGRWDLWDAAGEVRIDQANGNGAIVPVPAGTVTLKEYANDAYVWASSVQVEPGAVTAVRLGAVQVIAPAGAVSGRWDLWDAAGEVRIDQANGNGEIVPVPAGTVTLKEYANDAYVWASGLQVQPGAVTAVRLGAVQVIAPAGAASGRWDLWDAAGEVRIDQANGNGEIVAVPTGTYVIRSYASNEVIGRGVVVSAGEVSVVGR